MYQPSGIEQEFTLVRKIKQLLLQYSILIIITILYLLDRFVVTTRVINGHRTVIFAEQFGVRFGTLILVIIILLASIPMLRPMKHKDFFQGQRRE